jgi:hypothetical protein
VSDLIAHGSLALATIVAWFGAGSLVLAPVPVTDDRALVVLNRIGAGALVFALATFAAGWAGVLSSASYVAVFVVAAGGGGVVAVRLVATSTRPRVLSWRWWELALLALLTLYVLLGFVATCAPISSPDALLYHAADPALFERAGQIFEIPWNSSSYEPFTVEMLVLDGFLLWDPIQGAFAPFLLALVALFAVIGVTQRLAGRSAGLLAGAVFFAQPLMMWEGTSVFIEPGLALALALASWNVLHFMRTGDTTALGLAGAFAGAAAGMKYLGIIVALALSAAVAGLLWRRLSRSQALAFAIPALLIPLPWYVKNAVLTGNPVYPHIFGGLNPSAAAELNATMASFGHGRSLLDFLALPFRLLADASAFDGGEFISPLFLAFGPLALLLPKRRRPPRIVLVAILLYVVAWFLTSQQARFLVPLMPAVAVLAALGALALAAQGRMGRIAATGATGAVLLTGLGVSSVYAAQFAPVVIGRESQEEFLERKVSIYHGIEWLNARLGQDDKVVVDVWSLLYLEVPYLTFGTMGDLLPPDAGREATRSFVERYSVSHVAVLSDDTARRRQVEFLDARLIARVQVRSVRSRTRNEQSVPKTMLIYALEKQAEAADS